MDSLRSPCAPKIATLLQMSADDYSVRRFDPADPRWGPRRHGGVSGRAPRCGLSAAASDVPRRVNRLLSSDRIPRKLRRPVECWAGVILVLPLAVVALSG